MKIDAHKADENRPLQAWGLFILLLCVRSTTERLPVAIARPGPPAQPRTPQATRAASPATANA